MTGEIGHFDMVHGNVAEGWAANPDSHDTPAHVDILVDGRMIGGAVADLYREDLRNVGIRDGYAAFSFDIPLSYYDGEEHRIDVVLRELDQPIWHSPRSFRGVPGEIPLVTKRRAWAEREVLVRKSDRANKMAVSVADKRRLAIMSTYHSDSMFLAYHFALVKALTAEGFVVLVVHAGETIGHGLDAMDRDDCHLYIKRNIGYDFGSWAVGVFAVADLLAGIDELILLNDSIIGPAFDLGPVLDRMRARQADMVGLTDSYEGTYHLQSYFLWFGARACRSSVLQVFMARYSFSSDKPTVIREGELGLTKFFMEQGFTTGVLYAYETVAGAWLDKTPSLMSAIENLPLADLARSNSERPRSYRDALLERVDGIIASVVSGEPMNPSHFFWDVLLEDFGHPFLKRELLFVNPATVPTYFRITDLVARLAPGLHPNIMDARRRYGGQLVPCVR